MALRCRFHGFTAVAELKRCAILVQQFDVRLFPRLHCRGRIEAHFGLHGKRNTRTGFHGFTAVAELKRGASRRPHFFFDAVSTASLPWPN